MIGWLWRLLIGRFTSCDHKWETKEELQYVTKDTRAPAGKRVLLRCEKCGDWTMRDLI